MTLPFENDTNAVVKKLAKQNIKANHRTALSIMSAILIAATFMCTLCSLVQSYWNQRVQQEIFDSGNWDAQILEVQAVVLRTKRLAIDSLPSCAGHPLRPTL